MFVTLFISVPKIMFSQNCKFKIIMGYAIQKMIGFQTCLRQFSVSEKKILHVCSEVI